MNQEKVKTAISPYVYVGMVYDKVKKENIMNGKTNMIKKEITRFTIREILSIVSKHWGVSESDILRQTRKQVNVDARFTFFAALKLKFNLSLDTIGQINKRHHTSVIHGLRTFYNRYHSIDNFKNISDDIFSDLDIKYIGKKMTHSNEPYENKKRKRIC